MPESNLVDNNFNLEKKKSKEHGFGFHAVFDMRNFYDPIISSIAVLAKVAVVSWLQHL
jgi:nitrogen fixation protein FixH